MLGIILFVLIGQLVEGKGKSKGIMVAGKMQRTIIGGVVSDSSLLSTSAEAVKVIQGRAPTGKIEDAPISNLLC